MQDVAEPEPSSPPTPPPASENPGHDSVLPEETDPEQHTNMNSSTLSLDVDMSEADLEDISEKDIDNQLNCW